MKKRMDRARRSSRPAVPGAHFTFVEILISRKARKKRNRSFHELPESLATFWGARPSRLHPSASRRRNLSSEQVHLFGAAESLSLTIRVSFVLPKIFSTVKPGLLKCSY